VTVSWSGIGDTAGYRFKAYDADGNRAAYFDAEDMTLITASTSGMLPWQVYAVRVGVVPINGEGSDIVWGEADYICSACSPNVEPSYRPSSAKAYVPINILILRRKARQKGF
jgi:hypothetical protein